MQLLKVIDPKCLRMNDDDNEVFGLEGAQTEMFGLEGAQTREWSGKATQTR